jgi:hypothetical protein
MTYFQQLVKIFRKIFVLFVVKPGYSEWKLVSLYRGTTVMSYGFNSILILRLLSNFYLKFPQ